MSICKYCGSKIDWIQSKSGKSIPVEGESIDWGDHEKGDILVSELGDVAYTYKHDNDPHPQLTWYLCHFSTCVRSARNVSSVEAMEKIEELRKMLD